MSKQIFSTMEVDAIGEIMNISLGSSATAVSNMLDHRVDITTPQVSVVNAEDFSLGELEPAIGVEIKYVTGLEGSNIMLLKMSDVKAIVDILMGMETPEEEFELNELTLSAVCEVMNQMMGAAATALSDFLGRMVNISTPQTFDGNDIVQMRKERLPVAEGPIVVVQFALSIEGMMKSEFMNVISVELARELVAGFGIDVSELEEAGKEEPASAPETSDGGTLSQEEIEALMMGEASPAPEPSSGGTLSQEEIEALMMGGAAAPAPEPSSGSKMSQEEIEALMMGGSAPAPAPEPSSGSKMSQEEIEALMSGTAQPVAPTQQQAPSIPQGMQGMSQGMPQGMQGMPQGMPQGMQGMPQGMPQGMQSMPQGMPQGMQGMPQGMPGFYPPYMMYPPGWPPMDGSGGYPPYMMYPPPGWPPKEKEEEKNEAKDKQKKKPESKVVQTKSASMPNLESETELDKDQAQNLDLIMNVPLEIAVEIGRTQKKVQDILSFSKGSLVVLDKLAGDQVDLYVNGKCIAHGDVVVIDDNFGIRINEILRKPEFGNIT